MVFVSEIETESVERAREVRRAVDTNGGLLDLLLLAELAQEQHADLCRQRLKQPYVTDLVRFGIDRRKQPVAFVVDLDHRLIHRYVIRLGVAAGLEIGLLHPVVDSGSTPFDT